MNHLSAQLLEAASLMGLGMAFVFAFLSLAIVAVNLLARFAGEPAPAAPPAITAATGVHGPSPQQLAAISAAIAQYKKNHKR